MTADERTASAGRAGAAGHRPANPARRIVKAWPTLDATAQAEVIGIVATGVPCGAGSSYLKSVRVERRSRRVCGTVC
jgi:hypothetical protein